MKPPGAAMRAIGARCRMAPKGNPPATGQAVRLIKEPAPVDDSAGTEAAGDADAASWKASPRPACSASAALAAPATSPPCGASPTFAKAPLRDIVPLAVTRLAEAL